MLALSLFFACSIALKHTPSDPRLELPSGPEAVAWAATGDVAARAPEKSGGVWPAWPSGWESAGVWERWETLVTSASTDPARSFDLALLAHAQGRHTDLWQHFAGIEDAATLRALDEALFASRLIDGVLHIAPPLPPPNRELPELSYIGQQLSRTWTTAGGTTLKLVVKIEPDGTEVNVIHGSGPAVDVAVTLPVPPGLRVSVVYADWMRQDDPLAPLHFRVSAANPDDPDDEGGEHTAWGRYLPAPRYWPREQPAQLPAGLRLSGLELVWAGADTLPARLELAARSYGRLLGTPARVVRALEPHAGPAPLRIHLGADTAPKELDLFGLVERWAQNASLPSSDDANQRSDR